MVLDLAQHYGQGAIQLGEIANRQNISLKYLEQIIRPLKKAGLVESFRGAKGGHILSKPPDEVTVGDVVALLEGGNTLVNCAKEPDACDRVDSCVTRYIWMEAASAMYERLSAISFADLLTMNENGCRDKIINYLTSNENSSQDIK
jgi:Rrf2 family protein